MGNYGAMEFHLGSPFVTKGLSMRRDFQAPKRHDVTLDKG